MQWAAHLCVDTGACCLRGAAAEGWGAPGTGPGAAGQEPTATAQAATGGLPPPPSPSFLNYQSSAEARLCPAAPDSWSVELGPSRSLL